MAIEREVTIRLNVAAGKTSGVNNLLAGASQQIQRQATSALGDKFGQQIHQQMEARNYLKFLSQPDTIRRQAVEQIRMERAAEKYQDRLQNELERLDPSRRPGPKGFLDNLLGGQQGKTQMAGFLGNLAGGNAVGGAISIAGPWGVIIAGVVEGLNKLWDFLKSSVELANPAAMKRYQIAWDDLMATIGHKLTPIIDAATDAVRLFADTIHDIIPGLNDMNPTQRRALGLGVTSLISPLLGAIGGLRWAAETLGLATPGSSIGAAARPAIFQGLEEYSKRAYLESYAGGADPAKETADNTRETAAGIETIISILSPLSTGYNLAAHAIQGLR